MVTKFYINSFSGKGPEIIKENIKYNIIALFYTFQKN